MGTHITTAQFAGVTNLIEPSKLHPALAQAFVNVETERQTLLSAQSPLQTDTYCTNSFYVKRSNFELWSDKKLSVEYHNGFVYHTSKGVDSLSRLVRYDPATETSEFVGFDKPAPEGGLVIAETGDYYKEAEFYYARYYYAMTYYNEVTGEESEPQLSSVFPAQRVIKQLYITVYNVPSSATHMRIYRVGFYATKFSLVTEIPFSDPDWVITGPVYEYLYEDRIADTGLTLLMTTRGTVVPPVGLCNLTFHNGRFYASVGSRVRFSNFGNASAWDALSYIDFESDVTGIASLNGGLLILLETKVFMLFGYDVDNYSLMSLTGDIGCAHPESVAYFRNLVVWYTYNGIACSDGNGVQYLTKDIYKFPSDMAIRDSAVSKDSYWLLTSDYLYEIDMANDVEFRMYTHNNLESLSVYQYDLMGIAAGEALVKLFQGTSQETLTYKSRKFTTNGYLARYEAIKLSFTFKGAFDVTIFEDNDIILSNFKVSSDIIKIYDYEFSVARNDVSALVVAFEGVGEIIAYTLIVGFPELENELQQG